MENCQSSAGAETKKETNKRFLMLFLNDNEKRYEKIASALEKGDITTARRQAHTLKSNAAQIGKTLLRNAANDIETNLKDGLNHVSEEMLNILEAELKAVLNEIRPLAKEYAAELEFAKSQIKAPDTETIMKTLDELEPLLRDSDSECFNYMDTLSSIPGAEKLLQCMEEYELKDAQNELKKLRTLLS